MAEIWNCERCGYPTPDDWKRLRELAQPACFTTDARGRTICTRCDQADRLELLEADFALLLERETP